MKVRHAFVESTSNSSELNSYSRPFVKTPELTAREPCRRNQTFWTLWLWIIVTWIIVSSCSFVLLPPSRTEPSLLPLTFFPQPLHLRGQSPWAISSMCVCCTRLLHEFGVCSVTLCYNIRALTWRVESNQTLAATVWLDSPLQQLFYATVALRRLETVDEGYEYVCVFFFFAESLPHCPPRLLPQYLLLLIRVHSGHQATLDISNCWF